MWRCAARPPWLPHLIYTIVWGAPVVTTQLGSGLYKFRSQNTVYLCYDSVQNVPGKPTARTPLKVYYVILLACEAQHLGVTICALFLHKFAVKLAAVFARGVRLFPKRVHSPEQHFRLLNGLLQPCLLWCFPSAPGNDNHLERQPARNR